ncbi:hypothetical protein BC830DRAFT_508445 [Chytriomyces sp. MP71]|nr:hypothetical protein BC830DRAFT_508445 [Chytriomyces sp. MP71]
MVDVIFVHTLTTLVNAICSALRVFLVVLPRSQRFTPMNGWLKCFWSQFLEGGNFCVLKQHYSLSVLDDHHFGLEFLENAGSMDNIYHMMESPATLGHFRTLRFISLLSPISLLVDYRGVSHFRMILRTSVLFFFHTS